MGERLFLNHCAQCHGSDAGGAKGFPNLRDKDWLYGGDPETIKAKHHQRPQRHHAAVRGGARRRRRQERGELRAQPVRTDRRQPARAARQAAVPAELRGLPRADGKGNQQIGAPNLTDQIWLYGGSEATIIETITKGRGTASTVTRMPAHKD